MPVHQVWVLNRHDHNRMVLPDLFSHPPANLPTPSPRLTVLGIALCSPQAEVEQRCSMEDLERFACEIIERVDAMLVPRMLSPAATAGSASTLTVQVQVVPGNVAVRERKWGGSEAFFCGFAHTHSLDLSTIESPRPTCWRRLQVSTCATGRRPCTRPTPPPFTATLSSFKSACALSRSSARVGAILP